MSRRRFISASRDQAFLLPPDMRDWLSDDHLVWVVVEALERCDLTGLDSAYRADGNGRPAYDPAVMAALLLYAYASGERSSRVIERRSREDIAFRVIAAGLLPDHVTIARFRRRHADALIGLFSQVLGLCERAGLVRLGTIAIDGTKVCANASKERFAPVAEAANLLAEAEARDVAEEQLDPGRQDALRGASGAGAPAERRTRFDQAAESLTDDERAAPRPAAPEPRQSNKARGRRLAAERKGSQNLTDPDSRVMKARRGFVQGYNAQVAVDENHVIVACDVSSAVNDHRLLEPMVVAARRETSAASGRPPEFIADSGYWNGEAVERLHAGGERLLVPPNGRPRTRGLGGSSTVTKMTEILAEPDAARRYRRRQALVEPVIAHVKCNRRLDRFLLRGQAGVRLEWSLGCTAHNLHRLARAG